MSGQSETQRGSLRAFIEMSRNIILQGQLLTGVRACTRSAAEWLDQQAHDHRSGVRCISIPGDPRERARFVRDWYARNRRQAAQGGLASVLVLPLLAQAAETSESGQTVSVLAIRGVVDWILQDDDSLALVLRGGQVVRIDAADVTTDGDQIEVDVDAVLAKGLELDGLDASRLIKLEALEMVDTAELNPDGSATLTMVDGVRMRLDPAAVSVVDGSVMATTEQARQHGLLDGQVTGGGRGEESWIPQVDTTLVALGAAGVGGIALALGSSGSDSSNGAGPPGMPTFSSSGYVIDGYLADAVVSRGSASVRTDDNGFFQDLGSTPDNPIVVTGGIDISTGQNFTGTLLAPGSATVVTPLTSLVQAAIQAGASPEQAIQGVVARLGLSSQLANPSADTWLLDFDPIAAVADGGSNAELGLQTLKAGVQLASLLQVAAQGNAEGYAQLTQSFAEGLLAGSFDFTSAANIQNFLAAAGASADVQARAGAIAAANQAIADASELAEIAVLQQAIVRDVPGIVPEGLPGDQSPPAPDLTFPEVLGATSLLDGATLLVELPAGTQLPAGARLTVTQLEGDDGQVRVRTVAFDGNSAELVLDGAYLQSLSGGALTLQAFVSVPGLGVTSGLVEVTATINPLLELNAAADPQATLVAVAQLQALQVLPEIGFAELAEGQRLAVAEALLAARPPAGWEDVSALASQYVEQLAALLGPAGLLEQINLAETPAELDSILTEALAALGIDLPGLAELGAGTRQALLGDIIANRPAGGYESAAELQAVVEPLVDFYVFAQALQTAVNEGDVEALDPAGFAAALEGVQGLSLSGGMLDAESIAALQQVFEQLAVLQTEQPQQFAAVATLSLGLAGGGLTAAAFTDLLTQAEAALGGETLRWQGSRLTDVELQRVGEIFGALSEDAQQAVVDNFDTFSFDPLLSPLLEVRNAMLDGLIVEIQGATLPPGSLALRNTTVALLEDARDDALTVEDFAPGGRIDQIRDGLAAAENQGFELTFASITLTSEQLQSWLDAFNSFSPAGQEALLSAIDAGFNLDISRGLVAEVNAAEDLAAMLEALDTVATVEEVLGGDQLLPRELASEEARTAYAEALLDLRASAGGQFQDFDALLAASETALASIDAGETGAQQVDLLTFAAGGQESADGLLDEQEDLELLIAGVQDQPATWDTQPDAGTGGAGDDPVLLLDNSMTFTDPDPYDPGLHS